VIALGIYLGVAALIWFGMAKEGIADWREGIQVLVVGAFWPGLLVGGLLGFALSKVAPRLFGRRDR
jgi:hypothetical protein